MTNVVFLCAVAVYPRPLVLQPSLPTYICSFASPCAAVTATSNVLPCVPSSTVLGSPVSSVLWSPRSADVGVTVSQGNGLNFNIPQSPATGELTLPFDHVTSRSQAYVERPGPSLQPVSSPLSSGGGILPGSPQPSGGISPTVLNQFTSQLVTRLPADVKSVFEADSKEQPAEILRAVQRDGTDVVRQLCISPQLASIAKQLFPPPAVEVPRTSESISRWRSQPALLQPEQPQIETSAFSSRCNCLQLDADLSLPSSQSAMRSLGQLGYAPTHRLEASGRYWCVLCLENVCVRAEYAVLLNS